MQEDTGKGVTYDRLESPSGTSKLVVCFSLARKIRLRVVIDIEDESASSSTILNAHCILSIDHLDFRCLHFIHAFAFFPTVPMSIFSDEESVVFMRMALIGERLTNKNHMQTGPLRRFGLYTSDCSKVHSDKEQNPTVVSYLGSYDDGENISPIFQINTMKVTLKLTGTGYTRAGNCLSNRIFTLLFGLRYSASSVLILKPCIW